MESVAEIVKTQTENNNTKTNSTLKIQYFECKIEELQKKKYENSLFMLCLVIECQSYYETEICIGVFTLKSKAISAQLEFIEKLGSKSNCYFDIREYGHSSYIDLNSDTVDILYTEDTEDYDITFKFIGIVYNDVTFTNENEKNKEYKKRQIYVNKNYFNTLIL